MKGLGTARAGDGRLRPLLLVSLVGVACLLALPSIARATVSMCNVPITMSDGNVLRANIFLPSGTGRYPTVLTATGYNKDAANPTGTELRSVTGNRRRRTGSDRKGLRGDGVRRPRNGRVSGGKWESWGQRTQEDYKEVLNWIQAQSWSNSKVATTGESYMGITSLLIAEADATRVAEGKPRAVDAVWADIPMADAYRDVTFQGGALDSGFMPLWLGLVTGLSALPPSSRRRPGRSSADLHRTPARQRRIRRRKADRARARWRSVLRRAVLPAALTRRARGRNRRSGRDPGWLVRPVPARRAAAVGIADATRPTACCSCRPTTTSPRAGDGRPEPQAGMVQPLAAAGRRTASSSTPKVNLYSINGEHWEHFTRFPLPKTSYEHLYLSGAASGSSAISLHDGSLASAPPGQRRRRHGAAAARLEPVLADDGAVDGGRGLQPASATRTTTPSRPPRSPTRPSRCTATTKITGLITGNLWAN